MAKRKSASGGQSQGPRKQAAEGASRSPANTHRPVNTGHPQTGKALKEHSTSLGTGAAASRPPQPQVTANRPPNGTRCQGPGKGAPKSQGANGQPSNSAAARAQGPGNEAPKKSHGANGQPPNFAARVEAMSGPRISQGRSMNEGGPKHNGKGPNNHPQKAQEHASQPNGSSKQQQAPQPPKHSQPFFGGHSPAPNPALSSAAPLRPPHSGNVHVPKAHGTSMAGNKAFQDPSLTSKQSDHTQRHVQKTQNHHVPTPPTTASQTHQQQSGKNTANNTFPKVQVAEMHAQARQSSRGSQLESSATSATSKGPGRNASHKSQQQHRAAPSHSHPVQNASDQGHKNLDTPPKPSTNDRRQGQSPTAGPGGLIKIFFGSQSAEPHTSQVEAMSGSRASQGRSTNEGAPKRNGNGSNNHPQKAQGHGPQPTNDSSKQQQAPKPPKHHDSQSFFGGLSLLAPNSALPSPAPPRPPHPGKVQHHDVHVPRAHGTSVAGKKAFQDPSLTCKTPETHAQQSSHGSQSSAAKGPEKNSSRRGQGQPPTTESVLSKAFFSADGKNTGNRSSNLVIPPQAESTRSSPAFGSGSLHSRTGKKQGPNVNQGTASVPQAAAASPGWFGTLSSWFIPSVNNRAQATSQPISSSRKAKDAGPKPQAPKSSKDKDSSSKSHLAPTLTFVSPESLKKKPMSPTKGTNNGLQNLNLQNKSSGLDTLFSATSPKKAQAPAHHNTLTRSDSGPGGSSSVSKKPEMATNLTFALSPTMDRSQMPSKPQKVQGSPTVKPKKSTAANVPHRKKVPVRLGSSKVFSHPTTTAALRKKLLRQRGPTLIWRAGDTPGTVSAYSTLTAAPVPSPPKNELQNKVARRTISQNPDLFKVVSPIKADVFKEHLTDHPNPTFVNSVVRSLKNGFWPWADTSDPSFPTTNDGSAQRRSPITSKDKAEFIKQQSEDEMNLGRWSKPFGKELLPGMHSFPISAVPKSTPGKFRIVGDQSRGPHALNTTIPKSKVKIKLDSIHDLGNKILDVRKKHPKRKIRLWKSDVKSAYRQLPIHPLWQIKQAVPVEGEFHIDRCNTFGNRSGGRVWDSFSSLVNWIGIEKKGITDLLGYVDDNFGWEFEGNKRYYKPYKKHMPTKQAKLLELWDELGIPHDEEKQLSGPSLRILGYDVDANAMTVKVPDEKKEKVVQLLRSNAHEGKAYTMNELQSVAGSVASALSLYPRLRPGLNVLFDEMAQQKPGATKLKVTTDVARSLSELANYLEHAPPVPIQEQKKSVRGTIGARAK